MLRRCAAVVVRSASLFIVTLCAACSPTFDWREVRPEGGGVKALFPCKPATETRTVELAGARVPMTMYSCRAGDALFAVAHADVGDPALVAPTLRQMRESAARNVGVPVPAATALSVRGMTPNAETGRFRLDGRRPDGGAVREEVASFTRGTTVYQATVLGDAPDAQAIDTFLSELAVSP